MRVTDGPQDPMMVEGLTVPGWSCREPRLLALLSPAPGAKPGLSRTARPTWNERHLYPWALSNG